MYRLYVFFLFSVWIGPVNVDGQTGSVNLINRLRDLNKNGILIGQQDALFAGVNKLVYRRQNISVSDFKDVVGSHPAIFGWDLGKIEIGSKANFDKVPFDEILYKAKMVHKMGGINTFTWHCNNFLDPRAGVRTKVSNQIVTRIFQNSTNLIRLNNALDSVANFFSKLRDDNGGLIPVIFRPFHENNGNWFWWGKNNCTDADYVKLWRYSVDYLRKKKGMDNILFVYSTDSFASQTDYLARYPGDNYADILGFDFYDKEAYHSRKGDNNFKKRLTKMIGILRNIANKKNKPFAIAETGYKNMPANTWWTETLYPSISGSGLSYVLLWRNTSNQAFWTTYKGQKSAADFLKFSKYPNILLLNNIQ